MKTTLLALAAALIVTSAPFAANAAVDRAVIEEYLLNQNVANFTVGYLDGSTLMDYATLGVPYTGVSTGDDYQQAIRSAVQADATSKGYTLSNGVFFPALSKSDVQQLISSSTIATPSFANPALTLNNARRASMTRTAFVSASVEQATTLSLTTGQTATAFFEYADNNGFTQNVVECGRSTNGNTGTLTVGLNLTQTNTATLSCLVPAGKYYRIRTAGTGTQTFRSAQEVLLF